MLPPELLEMIRSGGAALAPVFALLWWLERDERRDAQSELRVASREFTSAINEAKSAILQLTTILNPIRR